MEQNITASRGRFKTISPFFDSWEGVLSAFSLKFEWTWNIFRIHIDIFVGESDGNKSWIYSRIFRTRHSSECQKVISK